MYCLRISTAATNQGVLSTVESMRDGQSVCLLDGAHARLSKVQIDRLDPSHNELRGILSKPLHHSLCVALFLFLISLFVILEETEATLTRLKKDVSKKRV